MTRPTLEDMEAELGAACMSVLGNTIQYRPVGGAWAEMKAYVDYSDEDLQVGQGELVAQAITVEVLKSDVLAKPTKDSRVQLAKRPAETFRPVNVRSDESGDYWVFELEKVFV